MNIELNIELEDYTKLPNALGCPTCNGAVETIVKDNKAYCNECWSSLWFSWKVKDLIVKD